MAWGTLTLVAGPNGAGKTTLIRSLKASGGLAGHVILNADDSTLVKIREAGYVGFADAPFDLLKEFFIQSAEEVYREATTRLQSGKVVCLETVLSTGKYRSLVDSLQANGGAFELVYVALQSHFISRERISFRVFKGGHDVPESKLAERWRRSLEELKWFVQRQIDFPFTTTPGNRRNSWRRVNGAESPGLCDRIRCFLNFAMSWRRPSKILHDSALS